MLVKNCVHLWLALLATILPSELSASSVAVMRTPAYIVIAADGRAVDSYGTAFEIAECKIRNAGKFFYVATNLVGNPASGYDLHRIIASNVQIMQSTILPATKFKEIITPLLKNALLRERKENPTTFRQNFESDVLGVTFAGIESGKPSMIDLTFKIEDLDAENISLRIDEHQCPGKDCSAGYAFVFAPFKLKDRFERSHPNYWIGDGSTLARNAEAFVQMAIDDHLPSVGPPISVLLLSTRGIAWRKNGACDAPPTKSFR